MKSSLVRSDNTLVDPTMVAASTRSIFTVARVEDLNLLRRRGKTRGRIGVQITLPGLDQERLASFERRVERSMSACGCNEGTVAGLLYLIAVPTLVLTGRLAPSAPLGWIAAGGGFIAVLMAGKLFGLVIARLTLFRTLDQIERVFRRNAKEHDNGL